MENNASRSHLRELHGSSYEIVDGQPNIIGWTIRDANNHRIGVVDDLLFDADQQKVRYIIANLKDNHFELDKRKVLIPIGIAELHETNDDVVVPKVASWQLRALPTYSDRITDRDEQEIYTVFSTPSTSMQQAESSGTVWQKPQNFYEHPSFDHDNMFKKRRAGTLQDQPIERKLQMRQGATDTGVTGTRAGSEEYSSSRPAHDSHAMAASLQSGTTSSSGPRHENNLDSEKLLNKIKRVQSELDEIERDLRNNRGI